MKNIVKKGKDGAEEKSDLLLAPRRADAAGRTTARANDRRGTNESPVAGTVRPDAVLAGVFTCAPVWD